MIIYYIGFSSVIFKGEISPTDFNKAKSSTGLLYYEIPSQFYQDFSKGFYDWDGEAVSDALLFDKDFYLDEDRIFILVYPRIPLDLRDLKIIFQSLGSAGRFFLGRGDVVHNPRKGISFNLKETYPLDKLLT